MRTLAALLVVAVAAGCGSARTLGPDKAGGTRGRAVLRIAVAYDPQQQSAALVRYFADQLRRLSAGKLHVRLVYGAGGVDDPYAEVHVARLVEAGRFDLGWIGTDAWDELGVDSFQALQAPFLVTSYPLRDRVVEELGAQMLAGLRSRHLVGIALIPGLLRHPGSTKRPLVSLHDFTGARIRSQPSRASDALYRALGATSVHVEGEGIGASIAFEHLDGHEVTFANPPVSSIITANVSFFPQVLTLFAADRTYARLSSEDRALVDAAARRTLAHVSGFPIRQELAYEGVLARWYCKHTPGRVALASPRQLRALAAATRPVYRSLERDPLTRRLIGAIRRMKAALPAPRPIAVPATCLHPRYPRLAGPTRSPSLLNGTYHWFLTKKAALAFGPPADDASNLGGYPAYNGVVLRNGRAVTIDGNQPMSGVYTVTGDHVTFVWRDFGYPLTFRFRRDADGTLHLRAVHPMDRGDEWVWSGAPWRRVGAPVLTP
jgi:TRAP-type C4-dicarboxylate transport system substrate-binding protein